MMKPRFLDVEDGVIRVLAHGLPVAYGRSLFPQQPLLTLPNILQQPNLPQRRHRLVPDARQPHLLFILLPRLPDGRIRPARQESADHRPAQDGVVPLRVMAVQAVPHRPARPFISRLLLRLTDGLFLGPAQRLSRRDPDRRQRFPQRSGEGFVQPRANDDSLQFGKGSFDESQRWPGVSGHRVAHGRQLLNVSFDARHRLVQPVVGRESGTGRPFVSRPVQAQAFVQHGRDGRTTLQNFPAGGVVPCHHLVQVGSGLDRPVYLVRYSRSGQLSISARLVWSPNRCMAATTSPLSPAANKSPS
jgi:hypothetical protein